MDAGLYGWGSAMSASTPLVYLFISAVNSQQMMCCNTIWSSEHEILVSLALAVMANLGGGMYASHTATSVVN